MDGFVEVYKEVFTTVLKVRQSSPLLCWGLARNG
jgi:hypothetical protein